MITNINDFKKVIENNEPLVPIKTNEEINPEDKDKDKRNNLEDMLYVGDFEV